MDFGACVRYVTDSFALARRCVVHVVTLPEFYQELWALCGVGNAVTLIVMVIDHRLPRSLTLVYEGFVLFLFYSAHVVGRRDYRSIPRGSVASPAATPAPKPEKSTAVMHDR